MNHVARWAWAEVDLAAIQHNVGVLREMAAPSELWVVVKADGYGHGAVPVARTALAAGAHGLCVALTHEGVELRAAGITEPILVLSEQPPEHAEMLVLHDLIPTVYSEAAVYQLAEAVERSSTSRPYPVHIKVDTGMHRVGLAPSDLAAFLQLLQAMADVLKVEAIFTHLAVADEPSRSYTEHQLGTFDDALRASGNDSDMVTHVANSAGLLAHRTAHRSLVRAGIAMYGISPGSGVDGLAGNLRPALSLKARVSFVKRLHAGDMISYGLRHTFTKSTTVATIPIGYADGVPRRLFAVGGEVLLGGKRRSIVGVVTMDQLMVDCGDDDIAIGDEAVLIGDQGGERVTAAEWANRLDTIPYEIVCGISKRVQRFYLGAS